MSEKASAEKKFGRKKVLHFVNEASKNISKTSSHCIEYTFLATVGYDLQWHFCTTTLLCAHLKVHFRINVKKEHGCSLQHCIYNLTPRV